MKQFVGEEQDLLIQWKTYHNYKQLILYPKKYVKQTNSERRNVSISSDAVHEHYRLIAKIRRPLIA